MFIGFYWIAIGQPNPDYCCYYWADIAYQTTDWLMERLQVYSHFHIASMRFRLFQPVLYTVFRSPLAMYSVQVVLGIGYLYMVLGEAYKLLKDRQLALLFAAGFVGLYAGAAFILDVSGFGDAFAFTFMMGAIYFRNPLLIGLCVFLASWVDERAVFNVTLILAYHLLAPYKTERPISLTTLTDLRLNKQVIAALVGCSTYLAIRLYFIYRFNLSSPTGGESVFFAVFGAIKTAGFRLWSGYEGFWLLILAMLFLLWQRQKYLLLLIVGGLTGVTTFTVLMQGDYIRTIAYGFPILFIALALVSREISQRDLFWMLTAIIITTLLYPSPY
ncbi:hypothetical protein [Fibrella forsythiae]|uniref:Glycosyltransferase RgtA/B/C/D-like domain-containing protein n=1 Tax=Fibrella forsythiae TaxID=2817061 RepID=A0ABS3JLU7_9BACT|nr:hypothetical protein [Fibrella forsythiae]MBO0950174.1 hypothetical protein [Fibrella forsythiae]